MDLEIKRFDEIDINDSFFDRLRGNYPEFNQWFAKKADAGETAYVFYGKGRKLTDFLYLKVETGPLADVDPLLPSKKRLKVGTFKIEPRGTRRGERFMKKIMDRAVAEDVDEIYVTVFPTDELKRLIDYFFAFGFKHIADKRHGEFGAEWVLVKNMRELEGDIIKDYPFVRVSRTNKRLLSIKPCYHTKLFTDSILQNEHYDIVQDNTPSNGIFKIYICWMKDTATLKRGDNVVIYRTGDGQGPAYYRSVATSICTVVEVKQYGNFLGLEDFLKYTEYSVFTEEERRSWFKEKRDFIVIKMLYNVAFTRKVTRKELLEDVGISKDDYWGFCALSDNQFNTIIKLGGANERYYVD